MPRIKELHHITRIRNVPSILRHGILCAESVGELFTSTFGSNRIRKNRQETITPDGLRLSQYTHLLLTARAPLWYHHLSHNPTDARNYAVLRISAEVLEREGCILSQWSQSAIPTFFSPKNSSAYLDMDVVNERRSVDMREYKRQKSTQVLLPYQIPANYIFGAFVAKPFLVREMKLTAPALDSVLPNPQLFFVDKIEAVAESLTKSENRRAGRAGFTAPSTWKPHPTDMKHERRGFEPSARSNVRIDEAGDFYASDTETEFECSPTTDSRYTSDEFWVDEDDELEFFY